MSLPPAPRAFLPAAAACVLLLVLVAAAGYHAAGSASPLTLQVWNWTASRRLAADEAADLAAMSTQAVCWWCGSVAREGGVVGFQVRGGRLLGCSASQEWPVIRVEPSCSPLLESAPGEVEAAVLAGWRRVQVAGVALAGLQLDWDVPARLLPAYARFLAHLRAGLPAGAGLSCTGLVGWLDAPGVAAVAQAVDWWVPQCYSADLPADPLGATALVARVDAGAVTARCEALGRPFRIGLPTFEQASVWAGDGRLLAAAVPLATEEALAAGLHGEAPDQRADGERLLRFRVGAELTLAGRQLPAGALLLIAQPTPASLGAQIAAVRAGARRWCAGISLFRMPRPGDMPCLSTCQLRAAWAAETAGPAAGPGLRWTWRRGERTWILALANPGREDLVRLDRPLRLAIAAVPLPGAPPPPLRLTSAIDGLPVGPAHATGALLLVPFLRAGATLDVAFVAAGVEPPACREPPAEEEP